MRRFIEWSGRTVKERLAVIAIGGNSLIVDKAHQGVADQRETFRVTARQVVSLVKEGFRVILSHGNGPQVGFILRRSELAREELHEVPLDCCVADTQGALGYMMQQVLAHELRREGLDTECVTVVTQVEVSAEDASFERPTKPIGSFMEQAEAERRAADDGWDVAEDSGRGWRRVVASPKPIDIVEESAIRFLAQAGYLVVAVGGGGIPVVRREDGQLEGVPAVIDKDHASALLANRLHAHYLMICTGVDKVYLSYGHKTQRGLYNVTLAQVRHYHEQGHFGVGSMGPKVEAAIAFLEAGGTAAIISSPQNMVEAMDGRSGTWIVRD